MLRHAEGLSVRDSNDRSGCFLTKVVLQPTDSRLSVAAVSCCCRHRHLHPQTNAGKTYIGVQLVCTLLANTRNSLADRKAADIVGSSVPLSKRPDIGPILVLCYTNHALDSFLLDLVHCGIDEGIIRVGRRCGLLFGDGVAIVCAVSCSQDWGASLTALAHSASWLA